MPPWVSLSTQDSNVLLQSGLDARFSVYGHLSSASLQRCPPHPRAGERWGDPQGSQSLSSAFILFFLWVFAFLVLYLGLLPEV